MKLEMETLKIASGPNGALLNELKKTFDIRIRSDNVIGRRHRWRHRTLSLTFLLEYVWRIDYGSEIIL